MTRLLVAGSLLVASVAWPACRPPAEEETGCWDTSSLPANLGSCPAGPWEKVTTSWTVQGAGAPQALWQALWSVPDAELWAVGPGGSVVQWNGTAWSNGPAGGPTNVLGIWASSSTDLWAVTQTNALRWDGQYWNIQPQQLQRIHGVTEKEVYGFDAQQRVLRRKESTWTDISVYAPWRGMQDVELTSIGQAKEDECWVAARRPVEGDNASTVHLVFRWDGQGWMSMLEQQGPTTSSAPWVQVAASNEVWALIHDDLKRYDGRTFGCSLGRNLAEFRSASAKEGGQLWLAGPSAVLWLSGGSWACERTRLAVQDGHGGLDAVTQTNRSELWGLKWPGPEVFRRRLTAPED